MLTNSEWGLSNDDLLWKTDLGRMIIRSLSLVQAITLSRLLNIGLDETRQIFAVEQCLFTGQQVRYTVFYGDLNLDDTVNSGYALTGRMMHMIEKAALKAYDDYRKRLADMEFDYWNSWSNDE